MNREIKFRGKRITIGKIEGWVFGFYNAKKNGDIILHRILYQPEGMNYTENVNVSGKTVGQFTGFHDKNGKEIYEGDILEIMTENDVNINVICEFGSAHRYMDTGVLCDIIGFYFVLPNGKKTFPIVYNYQGKHDSEIMEVIGNIHDHT